MTKKVFLMIIFLSGCECGEQNKTSSSPEASEVTPRTLQEIRPTTPNTPKRIADLTLIVIALEKYKQNHRSYPISSDSGQGWDGIHSKWGESREDWITGLAPEYIPALPRDPRMLSSDTQQYIYRSNGAHYKLLSYNPDDCNDVKKIQIDLLDPKRGCVAYGFWTPGASNW